MVNHMWVMIPGPVSSAIARCSPALIGFFQLPSFQHGLHLVEVTRHHHPQRLRVEPLAQRGRAHDIAKHDGDRLADFTMHSWGWHQLATFAESRIRFFHEHLLSWVEKSLLRSRCLDPADARGG